jgi:hypothetical protein
MPEIKQTMGSDDRRQNDIEPSIEPQTEPANDAQSEGENVTATEKPAGATIGGSLCGIGGRFTRSGNKKVGHST